MRSNILKLLLIWSLTGCFSQNQKQTTLALPEQTEVFTLYKKTDKLIEVKKALKKDKGLFELYTYEINISTPEGSRQKFISVEECTQQTDSIKNALSTTYNWIPLAGKKELFVQIQPNGAKDGLDFLKKRQELEDKIDKALKDENLGEWTAGDLGPGGGNMLYDVSDINSSLKTTLEVLHQNNLADKVVIGKRILLTKDDWFYEVIYPIKFSGMFNTM